MEKGCLEGKEKERLGMQERCNVLIYMYKHAQKLNYQHMTQYQEVSNALYPAATILAVIPPPQLCC